MPDGASPSLNRPASPSSGADRAAPTSHNRQIHLGRRRVIHSPETCHELRSAEASRVAATQDAPKTAAPGSRPSPLSLLLKAPGPQVDSQATLEPGNGCEVRPGSPVKHGEQRRVVEPGIACHGTHAPVTDGGLHIHRELTGHLADDIRRYGVGPPLCEFAGSRSGGSGHKPERRRRMPHRGATGLTSPPIDPSSRRWPNVPAHPSLCSSARWSSLSRPGEAPSKPVNKVSKKLSTRGDILSTIGRLYDIGEMAPEASAILAAL